jgi:hypothetical protein
MKISGVMAVLVMMGSAHVTPAVAYDPLCDRIGNTVRRGLCQCRSDAGALVRRSPHTGRVAYRGVPHRKVPQVHACMEAKGHRPA